MSKSSLLKDAIADAKAVRETALANARMRMQEAFTPRLQSMISAKLQNEIEGEDEEELTDTEPAVDEVPAEEVPAEAPAEAPVEEPVASEVPAEPAPEVPAEVPAEIPAETPVEPEVDIEVEPEGGEENLDDVEEEGYSEDFEDGYDELDLESIIRELDAESEMDEEVEEPVFTEAKEEGEKEEEEEEEEEEEKIEEAKFDLTSAPSNKSTADVTPNLTGEKGPTPGTQPESPDRGKPFNVKKDELVPDPLLKQNPKNAIYEEDEPAEDEEINIDEILKELEEADVSASIPDPLEDSTSNPFKTMNEQLKNKVGSLTKDLKEHRQVIRFLKSKLNEVNLLNAKLLFTSKLFKSNNMNNSQKMKVVESFDRAKTLREVKLVYTTIAESLTKIENKPSSTVKKITENISGGASKPVVAIKPVEKKALIKEAIVDENGASRLRKLAGIKIKK